MSVTFISASNVSFLVQYIFDTYYNGNKVFISRLHENKFKHYLFNFYT